MKSIQKLSAEEKEIELLISSLKNVLTDVPYNFEYETYDNDGEDDYDYEDEEFYEGDSLNLNGGNY